MNRVVFPDDGLPEELLGEFDVFVRERARELISEVDDWLAAAARRSVNKSANHVVTGLSIFHYVSKPEKKIELEKDVVSGR